jgi:hypothetical protein
MKIRRLFNMMPALAVLLVVALRLADGQEEKLVLNPPLSQIFPLDPKPDGMRLKFPVLLNERTILGPNVVLRFIYVDQNAGLHPRGGGNGGDQDGGADSGGHGHHHGGSSQDGDDASSAYSRSSSGQGGSTIQDAPLQDPADTTKGPMSEIRTEVWTEADLFREALDDAADQGTTLVYSVPGKQKPLSTTIDLPDGMLLAEIGGHVQVLGLTDDSRIFQSGVHPGDEIRSFAGHPAVASLNDFVRTYLTVKEEARKDGQSYSIEVWRPSESKLVTIQISAPPSLPSLF